MSILIAGDNFKASFKEINVVSFLLFGFPRFYLNTKFTHTHTNIYIYDDMRVDVTMYR